jgi:hypothetical protein
MTTIKDFLRFTLLFATLVGCCPNSSLGTPQNVQRQEPIIVDGTNNETTKAELDLLAQRAGKEKLIILIARLGKAEHSRKLSQRRLRTIRDYLRFTRAVSMERMVPAEGDRVRDVGRVDAYLDGKLFMVFELGRNKNFAPEP